MKRHIGGSRKKSILDHYDFYGNIDFCGCKHGKYQYNKLGGFRDIGRSAWPCNNLFNIGNTVSNIILVIEDNNWYVFKRIDEKYLLCGNRRNINDSTKTKLFSIDDIVEQNLCFEKVNTGAE